MFDKILIANRGEIACRVIRSARKMGIGTVAVYSEADRNALHVQLADEAVLIGPPPSAQSYLLKEKILQACLDTGAQAVHPGYGFLSENNDFAEALDKEGIAFIGPGAHAIDVMGDKITSKKLAEEAGVNTIPGYTGVVDGPDHAVRISGEIGYPVMLKASAGGGGKGMRVARNEEECRDGFERATNEARSSFGDDRVFIEKFIEEPRHIEIQVIADSHGNTLYLNERECSIQRRHQKVIEEAPSPFLDPKTRKAMGEQAVMLAKAVDYKSAGTVEFIVDADKNFYFLEMNTRLQVEHPVTELITGLDLVELMIRVAAGEKLPLTQKDVKLNGWAMETRVYAEDPFRNFLPSTGRVVKYQPPEENEHVRVDTGVYEGGEVSMFYDPMIAKLITYGATRDEAIGHMVDALDGYYIRGVGHNISFLNALMLHPRFQEGRLTTNFIAEEYPDGFTRECIAEGDHTIPAVVVAAVSYNYRARSAKISGQMPGHEATNINDWVIQVGDQQHMVHVGTSDNGYKVVLDGQDYDIVTDWKRTDRIFRGVINGKPVCLQMDFGTTACTVFYRGAEVSITMLSPMAAELQKHMLIKEPPDLSRFLLSPMPGLLVSVAVQEGETVEAGQELAVVEAMKMENSLRAVRNGLVKSIAAQPGATLKVDEIIIEFE